MKKSIVITVLTTVSVAACVTVGTAIYKWLTLGDKVSCVANEFNFGCSTMLGWVQSGIAVVVFVIAIYLWERFRGN